MAILGLNMILFIIILHIKLLNIKKNNCHYRNLPIWRISLVDINICNAIQILSVWSQLYDFSTAILNLSVSIAALI